LAAIWVGAGRPSGGAEAGHGTAGGAPRGRPPERGALIYAANARIIHRILCGD
jgi:hypothetical protein